MLDRALELGGAGWSRWGADGAREAAETIQKQMGEAQAKLDTIEIEGSSGGGLVKGVFHSHFQGSCRKRRQSRIRISLLFQQPCGFVNIRLQQRICRRAPGLHNIFSERNRLMTCLY